MQENNNTMIGKTNEIYAHIKSAKLLRAEVDIMKDITTIGHSIQYFSHTRAQSDIDNIVKKNRKDLQKAGYFKYIPADMDFNTPADRAKFDLEFLRGWLIRLAGLKACNKIAETELKELLKNSLKKYEESEGLEPGERYELAEKMINDFDDDLHGRLQKS